MPRRKKTPDRDFKKVKSKLGKKKAPALSATNTDFKSRTINVQDQGVGKEKGAVVSSKNLTLKELLNRCGHHNSSNRKDAVHGLRELVTQHTDQVAPQLSLVLDHVLPLIGDQDKTVRSGVVALVGQALEELGENLLPFLPLIMVHTVNAMTNLQKHVRMDAIKLLQLLVARFPNHVGRFGKEVLRNFVLMLGGGVKRAGAITGLSTVGGGIGGSSGGHHEILSKNARQGILLSLKEFLMACTQRGSFVSKRDVHAATTCGNSSSGGRSGASETMTSSSATVTRVWSDKKPGFSTQRSTLVSFASLGCSSAPVMNNVRPAPNGPAKQQSSRHNSGGSGGSGGGDGTSNSDLMSLDTLHQLFSVLLNSWLECCPSSLSISGGSGGGGGSGASDPYGGAYTSMSIIVDVLAMLLDFADLISEKAASEFKLPLKRYVTVHFPLSGGKRSDPQEMFRLNMGICRIITKITSCSLGGEVGAAVDSADNDNESDGNDNYYSVKSASGGGGGGGGGGRNKRRRKNKNTNNDAMEGERLYQFVCEVLTQSEGPADEGDRGNLLTEVVVALVRKSSAQRRDDLLANFTSYWIRQHPHGLEKERGIRVMQRLALESNYTLDLTRWLEAIPRLLWKLGDGSPVTSQVALEFCLFCARSPYARAFESIQQSCVPFFFTVVRGGRRVFGPFNRLPEHVQRLAIEILFYFDDFVKPMYRGLAACCCETDLSAESVRYLLDVLCHRTHTLESAQLFSDFLLTLLVGRGDAGDSEWVRDVVVRSLRSLSAQHADRTEPMVVCVLNLLKKPDLISDVRQRLLHFVLQCCRSFPATVPAVPELESGVTSTVWGLLSLSVEGQPKHCADAVIDVFPSCATQLFRRCCDNVDDPCTMRVANFLLQAYPEKVDDADVSTLQTAFRTKVQASDPLLQVFESNVLLKKLVV
eukprot:TRINITY_DN6201_c0_g1_i1.p1 TRINITY_DN6201_c0_g1~~TRINITY_DN6201_c0_g1_i1.p1  ORF type:complete len:928 (+),score=212.43 TRINITY_DN6201_c0_g1_i1:288-3071(+)